MITVEEIMTRNVYTLQAQDPILKAMAMMSEHNIRHIPIVDNQHQLLGVVSHRDLLRADLSSLREEDSEYKAKIESSPVENIMTKDVFSASPGDSLRRVGQTLQKGKFGCVPIIENHILVGIITETDFVAAALSLIEELEVFENAEVMS